MADWQLLLTADLIEGEEWQITPLTQYVEFRLDQSNPPRLGQFSLGQATIVDGRLEFFDIKTFPARSEPLRVTLNPGNHRERIIAVRWRYAEWDDQIFNWQISLWGNADFEEATTTTIALDISPRVLGAIASSEKGQPGGVAELGEDGLVPLDQLPPMEVDLPVITLESIGAEPAGRASEVKEEVLTIVESALDALDAADVGADPAGAAVDARNQVLAELKPLINALYPRNHFLPWWLGQVVGTTVLTRDFNAGYFLGIAAATSTRALNDEIFFSVALAAGNYVLEVRGERATANGRTAIFLEADLIGIIDWYATTLNRNYGEFKYFTVATSGRYKIRFVTNGTSGTGHQIRNSAVIIAPANV